MIRIILCFIFLSATHFGWSQQDSLSFPQAWEGIWKGDLAIYNAKGLAQKIPMELHILPIDSSDNYTWKIIYGEDKVAGLRPYELKVVDAQKGHYVVDEQNSIALDAFLLGGKLFERFSVMGSMLLATTEVRDSVMYYEIISGSETPLHTTGDTVIDEEEIPAVGAFPIVVRQYATLKRIK